MAATIELKYGTEAQAITCSLASLGSASSRESTAIDNTSNLYLDALVSVKVKTGAGAISSDKVFYVYVAGTVDAATPIWPDAVAGTGDAGVTLNSPSQLRLLGVIFTPASATTYSGGPWSVAEKFGGILPEKWLIVVNNASGTTADTTEGNFKKVYQGILAQSV